MGSFHGALSFRLEAVLASLTAEAAKAYYKSVFGYIENLDRLEQMEFPDDARDQETSVVADCSPSRAACMVCHESVAHLTRTGNSRTPAKILSLPR